MAEAEMAEGKVEELLSTDSSHTIRVISMDGGGIYGLATADLLKQLCQRDDSFLQKDEMPFYVFAGTSAGAVNALLLAREDDPRRFILEGGLEDFWRTSPIFDPPQDFWTWYWSFIGLTSWFGSKAYHESLRTLFGKDTTIYDLPHSAFICVFDYFGLDIPEASGGTSWGPCFYSNLFPSFENNSGNAAVSKRTDRVADVAYAAAAPAGYRRFVNGLGDGGAAVPSPELYSVLAIGRDADNFFAKHPVLAEKFAQSNPRVAMLSIGVCATPWYYWRDDVCALGFNAFWNWYPTNPFRGNWYPPICDFDVSAPTSTSNQESRDLLGKAYFRLNPALFGPPNATPPELIAMLWARNPQLRDWLISEVQKAVKSAVAENAVAAAWKFLHSPGWQQGVHISVGSI